jgi:hypothetical protein
MKILPLLLFIGGCSTTSMDELYMQRAACNAHGLECDELHERIDRRERFAEQREYDKRNRCPSDFIEYCDSSMRGCGRTHKSPTDQFACISPRDLRDLLR